MDDHKKRVIETALWCAQEPITAMDLTRLFVDDTSPADIEAVLTAIQEDWQSKGMELVHIATHGTSCTIIIIMGKCGDSC